MISDETLRAQAFAHKNTRLFTWFRVLFNCRFYYPVLAIFFVDMGLTISQYIMLNVIWAAVILLLEVPSGALADLIGRKRLVVGAAGIMIAEMFLLVIAPKDAGWWLFTVCAINRVLAGIAEAAASGADEALAYDSLDGKNKDKQWDEVLAVLTKRMSIFMGIAVVIGSIVYDQRLYHTLTSTLGVSEIPRSLIIRVPVILCLLEGVGALIIALKMKDVGKTTDQKPANLKQIIKQTLSAMKWIVSSKIVLAVILGMMLLDVATRNFATLTSTYYRYIHLPEYTYGMIGASFAIVGIFTPLVLKPMVRKFDFFQNFAIISTAALIGLFGIALIPNYAGVLAAMLIMLTLKMGGFVTSKFLNQLSTSEMRATILSVKGLLFNLGYAVFSIVFAQTLNYQKNNYGDNEQASDLAFADLLLWTPIMLSAAILAYFIVFKVLLKQQNNTIKLH